MKPVTSLAELCDVMMRSRRYGALATVAATKLGGDADSLRETRAWLLLLASQDGEQAVLDKVNACLPLDRRGPSVLGLAGEGWGDGFAGLLM